VAHRIAKEWRDSNCPFGIWTDERVAKWWQNSRKKVRFGMWVSVFFKHPQAKQNIWHLRRPSWNPFCAPPFIHQLPRLSSRRKKKCFTSHIPAHMYDDRSHKSNNTRTAQKKFDNAQHDFVMFLFHVHLFICLSLSNSAYEYIALTTHGYPRFLALRSKLHNA